jgi:hypothetical protein
MAVVIVMIAAVFGTSVAQAHEGHAHHPSAPAVTVQHAASAPVAVSAEAVQAVARTMTQAVGAAPADRLLSAALPRAQMPGQRPCNGTCCSMGVSCCAPGAMLPTAAAALPGQTVATRLIAPAEPFLAGVAREALPKPPRSLA